MRGFIGVSAALFVNLLVCGGSFLAGQTALIALGFVSFIVLLWLHGVQTGRAVDFQSPIRPRTATPTASTTRRASANGTRRQPQSSTEELLGG